MLEDEFSQKKSQIINSHKDFNLDLVGLRLGIF